MENYYPEIYFGSIHILVAIALFCSLLLWTQRDEGQRSRRFLALTWVLLFVVSLGWFYMIYQGDPIFERVLPIGVLVFGMALVATMTLYPIEVVVPRWLNKKRFLVLFSPIILTLAVCGAMQFFGGGFRTLNTMSDILRYSNEPNVWIRFPLVLIIYGYAFVLYYIPHNKMRGNITLGWIRAYTFGNIGIAFLYLGLILFRSYTAGILHSLYFAIYVGYITYQELYVRLFIPDSENTQYNSAGSKQYPSHLWSEVEKEMWTKLDDYMKKESAWHNPSLSMTIVTKAVGVTNADIARLLELKGYGEFEDYVAEFRIREFCNLVDNGECITIDDTFFKVGFRYRNIATRQFLRIMHQSPEEYIYKLEDTTFKR